MSDRAEDGIFEYKDGGRVYASSHSIRVADRAKGYAFEHRKKYLKERKRTREGVTLIAAFTASLEWFRLIYS